MALKIAIASGYSLSLHQQGINELPCTSISGFTRHLYLKKLQNFSLHQCHTRRLSSIKAVTKAYASSNTDIATSSLAPIAKRLEGKVALITGGASGIGERTARLFAQHGAKIVIADIQSELGHSVAEKIGSETGQPISYVQCDITKDSDMENAVNTVISKHGKLDIMFSNAGRGSYDPKISLTEHEDFMRVIEINVYGGVLAAKHAAKVMIPEKKGCILFTSSAASALYGGPYAYTASKHAIVGLAKNLAVELGEYGIRVNCISPGLLPTPLTKLMGDAEQVQGLASAMANLKEVKLDAEDVAHAALYLASDESKFVSGLNLLIDGAASLPSATRIN